MKIRKLKTILLIVACVFSNSILAANDESYAEALALFKSGDVTSAQEKLKPLVEANNIPAIRLHADIYKKVGAFEEADKIYMKGIALGDAYCMYEYAISLFPHGRPEHGKDDNKKSMRYLFQAAKKDFFMAHMQIASIYEHGELGVKKDQDTAFKWILVAANKGYPPALKKMSDIYTKGLLGKAASKKKSDHYQKKYQVATGTSPKSTEK